MLRSLRAAENKARNNYKLQGMNKEHIKPCICKTCTEARIAAYEKGFQAGHAKERWLKEQVERDAYKAGANAGIDAICNAVKLFKKYPHT